MRKALSAILRIGESHGAGHVIDILTGTLTDRVRDRGHDRLPTFGVGRDLARGEWQAVIRQMLGLDLIRPDPARHGALAITAAAHPVLRGTQAVTLRRDPRGQTRPANVLRTQVDDEDAPLFSALKARRRALAEAARVPAYVIFPDRTLIEMARLRPASLDQMARISGVGAKKLESYGEAFLAVIAGEVERLHPARRALAGRPAGELYDRLEAAQRRLARGEDGCARPLSVSPGVLRRIATERPRDLARYLDAARLERFADAFRAEIDAG